MNNKYDKYKDSGIEWIGEIPKHWNTRRLNVLAKLQTGNTPPKENDINTYYADEGFLWVKPDNLSNFNPIQDTNEYLNEEGYKIARVVPAGTPLVCCIGTIGKYGVANQDVAFNQQINAVIFNNMMNNKFGLYHISCQEEQHWFYANGNVVQILNSQNQGKILFACPPIDEQQRIADYLDKKCGEIDRVVETEKAVIEKLKVYKQSIITEAVTKGLDKTVPLKDSGIEWIGKIPQHWEVKNSRRFFKERKERLRNDDKQLTASQKYGIIAQEEFMKLENQKVMTVFKGEDILKHVEPNDFVISMRSFQGGIEHSRVRGCISSAYVMLIPNDKIYPLFYKWVFKSITYIQALQSTSNLIRDGQAMRFNNFVQVPIMLLPKEEQQQIADYLDKKCSEIDKAIADKEQVIEKFKEYKKSLIYECVTGKRKVC